jgi:hypothetical protein
MLAMLVSSCTSSSTSFESRSNKSFDGNGNFGKLDDRRTEDWDTSEKSGADVDRVICAGLSNPVGIGEC